MPAGSLSRPRETEEILRTRGSRSGDQGLMLELASWWGPVLLMLAPGAAVVYFGFNGGGFFPGAPAFVAMLLVQVLALRVLLADHPFAGFGRALGIAVTAMSLYTAWILASGLWSHSTSRALIE